jgi:hypothetical protein
VIWLFVALAAIGVFVVAAVTVGRVAFRLGHEPPATIFDLEEAVAYVADHLPNEAQARLTYDDVERLVEAELDHLHGKGLLGRLGEEPAVARQAVDGNGELPLVVADDDATAVVLGRVESEGMEVTDHEVYLVVSLLHEHLAAIGAIGPPASS